MATEGLTFDDVLLLPDYSDFRPSEADLRTHLSDGVPLNIPIVSAAMDTVTEARLAIALAQSGGIGVIHKNMSVEDQAAMVARVKKHEGGVVQNPITITPDERIRDLMALRDRHNISGVPVVDDGGKRLLGIVTSRDVRYESDPEREIREVMTPKERLVTAAPDADVPAVRALLREHRVEKVLLVDKRFNLRGMVTALDLDRQERFPHSCKDGEGHLRVAAAIGVADDGRAEALIEAGVDALVVDTAHGHSANVMNCVKRLRKKRATRVVAGNIATAAAAEALRDAGADAVKVGIGPGSICTTRMVSGVGVPQLSAVFEVARALRKTKVKVIADGGIRFSGDIVKALAAGADAVMVGGMLAGTEEAPGDLELYEGRSYKSYRGMGSLGAMGAQYGSSDRYGQDDVGAGKLVPEGIDGRVPYRGSVANVVDQLSGGVRSGMGYTGCRSIEALHKRAKFVRITGAGMHESHVHDVSIVREAPNYPLSG